MLSRLTPLHRDCGAICGAACCQGDEGGGNGMALFPGEMAAYQRLPQGFSISHGHPFAPQGLLRCQGSCRRDDRPLGCRIFPLRLTPRGGLRLDERAWPICPLLPSGLKGLSAGFIQAVLQVSRLLWQDPQQRAFIREQHQLALSYAKSPWEEEVAL